jgi:thiamine biosynthesis lipoprotein
MKHTKNKKYEKGKIQPFFQNRVSNRLKSGAKMLNIKYVVLLFLLLTFNCTKKVEIFKHSFFRMDTIVDVTIANKASFKPAPVWVEIDSILKDWGERFSIISEKSEVKKVNDRTNDTVKISKQLGEMIKFALRYGDTLDGDFDFTILPLKDVWGLSEGSPENAPVPTVSQIDSARVLVDYKKVKINSQGDTLYFSSHASKIDVGGVAKGFALKIIAQFLERKGITNYLVNGGGDIVGSGNKPDGSSWVIGIQDPRKTDRLLATFKLDSGSVFTSGDYERFRIIDGKRVHHIFNPHTGYSCTGNQSVTIYGPDPIENKFLSTGLFCRSADSIIIFVDKRPQIECLVVDSLGKVFISEGWKNKISLQK